MKRALVALCLALSVTRLCHAVGNDLLLVYGDALRSDPQLRQADAQRRAARENAPQAIAALLPQVTGSYAGLRQEQDSKQAEFFPSRTNADQLIAEPFNVSAYT